MAKSYDVTYTIGADDQTAAGLQSAIKNLTSPIERIQKQWTGFVRASGINAYIELAQKGFRAVKFAGEQYANFLAQKDRELAFKNLAQSVGTSMDKIVTSLKRASNETLTLDEILDSATTALFKGLKPEQLEKLMETARIATRITGHDLRSAFDNLSHAVATNSERLARQEGIIVDANKNQTVYQAILSKSTELNKTFGKSVNEYSERFKQAKTTITDSAKGIKDKILDIGSPATISSLEGVAFMLEKINKSMQPRSNQTPGDIVNQRGGLLRMKPMGEGARSRASWEIGAEEIARTEKNLEEIDWGKWAEDYAKVVDRSAAAILQSMENLDKQLQADVMVNGQSLEKLVDNQADSILEGLNRLDNVDQALEDYFAETGGTRFVGVGEQMGESLAEGFTYSAQRGISDGLFEMITEGKFDGKSIFKNFGMSMARVFSDAFAEALTAPMKSLFSTLFGSFLNMGVSAGATGLTGASVTGSGIPGTIPGAMSPQGITNNYYIQDDAMLEKRIDAAMTKSMRQNNFRQQLKASK